MRLVVDTNILISALLAAGSLPAHLIVLWREGRFDLLTSAAQLDELLLLRVNRCPKLRARLALVWAGRGSSAKTFFRTKCYFRPIFVESYRFSRYARAKPSVLWMRGRGVKFQSA